VTVLVSGETVLLAVMALFVVALLRSHAEILRRLEERAPETPLPQPYDRPSRTGRSPASDIQGTTPAGGARRVVVSPGPDTLLAFLSSGCSTCVRLLESVGEAGLPLGLRLVVVPKDRELERLRLLRPLAEGIEVVMSSEAWDAYGVPGSPYFVHVEGSSGEIVGEGSAGGWEQVVSLILDAADERANPDVAGRARIDEALATAGIGPGHPSLNPGAAVEARAG
jgi:hypothetical protein